MKQFVKVTSAHYESKEYWINLNHVVLMHKSKKETFISLAESSNFKSLYVKETPVEILDQVM